MSLMCYQASVPGTSHLALGVPNQDAFAVRRLRSSWSSSWSSSRAEPCGAWAHPACGGEFVVAAVADGLGSAELSELGSAVAAATVTNELSLFVAEHPDLGGIGDLVLEGAMHRALAAVNCKAAEVGADPAALATTLALCVWDGHGVAWACAGDSGIVGLFADGYRPLCRMDRKGHRNTVFSLSADDHWRFGVAEGVEGLVLATDGMLEQLAPGFVTPTSGADVDLADVEVNDLLLDLLLRLDPADAARPNDLSAAAEKFLGDLDPIDVYDDKTVVVLYKAPDVGEADGALDLDSPIVDEGTEDGASIDEQPGAAFAADPDDDPGDDSGDEAVDETEATPLGEPGGASRSSEPAPKPAAELAPSPADGPLSAPAAGRATGPQPIARSAISAAIDRAVPAVEQGGGDCRVDLRGEPGGAVARITAPASKVRYQSYRHIR